MSKHTAPFDNVKISHAALRLASEKGWAQVTLESVAKSAKIPVVPLKAHFRSTADLVSVIAETLDREAFVAQGKPAGTPHDILFDLLMARFDVLQKHRQAILSMTEAARQDRVLSCALVRATLAGLYRMIDAAKLDTPARPILAAGLSAVYGWAFFVWRRDNSRDLTKTMVAVDRALQRSGKLLLFLQKCG